MKRLILAAIFIGLLALAPLSASGQDNPDDPNRNNVVIVLDSSGSMNSTLRGRGDLKKIDAAKQALKEVINDIPADTNIGLLVFSANNISNDGVWVYPLGPRDNAKLTAAINLPQPGGGTPLGRFIKIGADQLLDQRAKQFGYGTYRLLIVTDGEADADDRPLMEEYVSEILARGITIDVIGVDMAKNHALATRVHSYRKADDPASLKIAIAEVFAEISDAGGDLAGEDAFALLAAIPDELAGAMIQALSVSGNHPIGEKPPVDVVPPDPETPPVASAGSTAPAGTPTPEPKSSFPWVIIVVAVVLVLALRSMFGKKKAGQRGGR